MVVGCFHVHPALFAFIILVSMMGAPLVLDPIFCLSFAVEGEAPRIQGGFLARQLPGIGPGLIFGAVGTVVWARVPEPLLVELSRHGDDFCILLVRFHSCPCRGIISVKLDEVPNLCRLVESVWGLDPSALGILYVRKEVVAGRFLQLCEHIGVETTSGVLFTVREISVYLIPLLLNRGKVCVEVVTTLDESKVPQFLLFDFVIDHQMGVDYLKYQF